MAACDTTRPLTEAQREAGFDQQRTGVGKALRPFSGSATVENLIDYCNRELVPVLRATREAANDVWKQVVDNAPSANPLSYYFSTTTAAADPTAGRIRLNQATQNTATIIRVSESNARLQSIQPWLDVMSGGPTTPLGTVTLLDAINPGRFLRFDLNTMTDQGAYWDLGVTFIEGSTASPFTDGEAVTIGFIAGVSAAGSTVPVSALTPIASDTFVGNVTAGVAAPTAVALSTLAGAGLTFGSHTINAIAGAGGSLVVGANDIQRAALTGFATASQDSNATSSAEPIVTYSASANMSAERVTTNSTSVTVDTSVASQIQFQRAALTGEATASANANAVTVTRSTNFQTSPWTGDHQFNAEVRLGTLHTESSVSGAFNVTLTAGATKLLITSTGDCTLGTISGCAEGRVLYVWHERASGSGSMTVSHGTGANAVACPDNRYAVFGARGSFVLVGRGNVWRMTGVARNEYPGVVQTDAGGGGNDFALNDATNILLATADATYTGFARASGNNDGDRFYLQCDAGVTITLPFNSSSSTSGNRVSGAEAVNYRVGTRGLIELIYRNTLWRIVDIGTSLAARYSSFSTVTNSTSAVTVASMSIPAGFSVAGTCVEFFGSFAWTRGSTATAVDVTMELKINGTQQAFYTTRVITTSGLSGDASIHGFFNILSVGATGSLRGRLSQQETAPFGATTTQNGIIVASIDTTSAITVAVDAFMSGAVANVTLNGTGGLVQVR